MGIDQVGQICVMIHSGSRGLGHQVRPRALFLPQLMVALSIHRAQVATDALTSMERAMARDNINPNDRQLACARIGSPEGQDYLVRNAALALQLNHCIDCVREMS